MDSQQQAWLQTVEEAVETKKITPGAGNNLRLWLTDEQYAGYLPILGALIEKGSWKELDDAFWTVIPFGTGGRRGKMFPVGTNAINDVTIGQSAQGLASYVLEYLAAEGASHQPSCAIAYDTRHRSREFAELCASIMAANGFQVWFLDGYRSTPEMSFMVRYKKCDCGIMVTASHNPPSDNAVKVYWSTGGQVLPPHDARIIDRVMHCEKVLKTPFADALAAGKVKYCQDEVDEAFFEAVLKVSQPGPRDLNVIYSPLHGVGGSCVLPVLERAGFENVELFALHAEPSGDFPNVPNHVSNPENPAVFDAIMAEAKEKGNVDLILATDPDADRLGCAVPKSFQTPDEWTTLTGNQMAAIMAEYLLHRMERNQTLTRDHYLVETLVTTPLLKQIADAYGIRTVRDLLVGFKYIGGAIETFGPEKFVLGAEESYGFLIGTHARDKDAAVASLVLCEIAAAAKAEGKTLYEKLADIFARYGTFAEDAFSIQMAGSDGMIRMTQLMELFQNDPPRVLGGQRVLYAHDYDSGTTLELATGRKTPLAGPKGKLVFLELEEPGNAVAVRPSGTEPKVKFYLFASVPPGSAENLSQRLAAVEADLRPFAETVSRFAN
ncbi:MAG: phospho-sugar mutase [Planctomycetia bacterium]|nr:phospho-sugar mutase [Planctomycetia bacterium]